MAEEENDKERLEFMVDKLELDNWNAEFEKTAARRREVIKDLKRVLEDKNSLD